MWSVMVTLLLNIQSLLEFHKGQSWAPYCFYFISMTCPTIYNPMSVDSQMTLQCTRQSKVRKTQISSKMTYIRGVIQKYAEKCYIIFVNLAIPLIITKSDL